MRMVWRERYLAFNLYAPRLLDPPRTPPGVESWHGYPLLSLIQSLPFIRSDLAAADPEADFIQFGAAFDFRPNSDLCAEFREFIVEFEKLRRSVNDTHPGPSIEQDQDFVTAAKYPFALRQMLRALVGEDFGFCFQLPYLIEAEDDLLVSFELAAQGYSKQPIQILRNVLEVTIAHAHFGLRGQNFEDLAASPDFRMPQFGGSNGMILALIKAGVMPANLAAECRSLYGRLSKATHSHIEIFTPNISDTGLSKDWAELTPRVGAVVLELILRLLMKGI